MKVQFAPTIELKPITPSPYQTAIFDWIDHGIGNAIINAVAGSGKSTTIKHAVKRVRGWSVFLAFNKAISDELAACGINARTFHSLCYMPVTKARNVREVNKNKIREMLDRILTDEERSYESWLARMLSIGRNSGIGCLLDDTPQNWAALSEKYEIELEEDERTSYVTGYALCSKMLEACYRSHEVDFDDLLYLAVRDGIVLPKFDWIFVDEAQDTNPIQRALLRKIFKPNARLVAVGDPYQSIYGFRGADSDAMNLIRDDFSCTELPLSISYRCATSIVRYAQQWVPHIESAPAAPEGTVTNHGFKWEPTQFKAGDLVVCRANAPLLKLAYRMLKNQIPVYVMGREIGDGLKTLIKKMRAKTLDALEAKLDKWAKRESEKAIAKKNDTKADNVADKAQALLVLIESLPEDRRTVNELIAVIDALFRERADATILASIHKSKGLEADTVWWLNASRMGSRSNQAWMQQQCLNLCYVATTRAKTTLNIIEEEPKK